MTIVDLPTYEGFKFRINKDRIMEISTEIDDFLISEPSLKKVKFKKEIPIDIQSNNKIEGLDDDINEINRIIKRRPVYDMFKENKECLRVSNLYDAYNYILKKKPINKENFHALYNIISDGLIQDYDLEHMGDYYREGPVCITSKAYFDEENEGLNYHKIEEYIDKLFNFIDKEKANNYTDYFTISQIIHFYIVYVHPYFDCNGRTSRTTAMWYLLNNKANAFLNFNRTIPFEKGKYNRAIQSSRTTSNLTYFVKYMLEVEKRQLEKEYIINSIEKTRKDTLTDDEYLLLEYFLSNNQMESLISLTNMFNNINDHRSSVSDVESKLEPFLSNGILIQSGETGKKLSSGRYNPKYMINPNALDIDPTKIKRLHLSNYVNK